MKSIINRLLLVVGSVLLISAVPLQAEKSLSLELINSAGKQRMLSQRIAKDYFAIGMGVNVSKAKKQLKKSIRLFNKTQAELAKRVKNPEVQDMVDFVDMSAEEFMQISQEKFNLDNGAIMLDLSESMLEGSQYIVDELARTSNSKTTSVIDLSGKQRMLAQRIGKYYLSYQAGIKDSNSITQMNAAVREFNDAHKALMANKKNTAQINKELKKIDRLWKIVYKFYLKIEKGGLPIIVYKTTDDIMKEMNSVTRLYVKLYAK